MERCLGIYIGDKVIKYAKLHMNKNKNVEAEAYGTKFVIGNKNQVIDEIINETNSQSTPISINLVDEQYAKLPVLKQLSKSDINSMVGLEIEDLANKAGINDKLLIHKYLLSDSSQKKDENIANIIYVDKNNIEQYAKMETVDLKGAYPLPYIIGNLLPKEAKNYMIVSIEEDTYITTVIGDQQAELKNMNIGMKEVLDGMAEQLGSYVKAYETCKSINVYTEDENPNNPEIERIIEPIFQDILHRIETELKNVRGKVDKIYLTGTGVLFTNIDMLFEQYFGVSTEIMKPLFIKDNSGIRNIAELIETNSAISLAYELLTDEHSDMNFSQDAVKKAKEKGEKKKFSFKFKLSEMTALGTVDTGDVLSKLIITTAVTGVVLIVYIAFGIIYNLQLDSMEKNMEARTSAIKEQRALIQKDVEYIKENTAKYKTVNDLVTTTINKIEGKEIGVLSTYNVANFMQKLMKFIPADVKVVSLTSDDNKKVTMTASSASYSSLGYFISQLKFESILNNVKINSVTHGSEITVSIGGELP